MNEHLTEGGLCKKDVQNVNLCNLHAFMPWPFLFNIMQDLMFFYFFRIVSLE